MTVDDGVQPRRRRVPRWAFLPFISVAAVAVITSLLQAEAIAVPARLALGPLLAFAVLVGARGLAATAPVVLLLATVLFAWLGDALPLFVPFLPHLTATIVLVGLAQLSLIVLVWRHIRLRQFSVVAVVAAVWAVAMWFFAVPGAATDTTLIAVFVFIASVATILACRCAPAVVLGSLFLLAAHTIWLWPTSLPSWSAALLITTQSLGYGLIAAGALATLRTRRTVPSSQATPERPQLTLLAD